MNEDMAVRHLVPHRFALAGIHYSCWEAHAVTWPRVHEVVDVMSFPHGWKPITKASGYHHSLAEHARQNSNEATPSTTVILPVVKTDQDALTQWAQLHRQPHMP